MVYSSRERSQTALDVWQDVAGISQLNALSKASTAKSPNSSKGLRSHQVIEASQRIESQAAHMHHQGWRECVDAGLAEPAEPRTPREPPFKAGSRLQLEGRSAQA